VDVAAIFVERSVRLLAPNGCLALLVPVKLWRSLAGGGVRRLLQSEMQLLAVEDFSDGTSAFDAAVYPSLVIARRSETPANQPAVEVTVHHRGDTTFTWSTPASSVAFDASPGAPWLLLPPDARSAFDRMRGAGPILSRSVLGRPLLGVKCGLNDAFIVELLDGDDDLADVRASGGRRFTIERPLLRPLLRGETLRRWSLAETTQHIIWTHGDDDLPLRELPPHAARWFARWRRHLTARSDSRHRARWWTLFRTESARVDRPRVVWGDVGKQPRACVVPAGERVVPLNSCYVLRCQSDTDARAFTALINSQHARAWLDALAEPARGGYRRYLGWTLSLLPIPSDWPRARDILSSIHQPNAAPPSDRVLFDATLDAYALGADDAAPLIDWCGR
jgi:hypothetical protein